MKKELDIPDTNPVNYICDLACCSGKLPDGMPGDKCIGEFMDKKGKPKHPRTGKNDCLACCDKTFPKPSDARHKDMCKKTCTLMGGGF